MDQQGAEPNPVVEPIAAAASPARISPVDTPAAPTGLAGRFWNGSAHILRVIGAFLIAYFFFFCMITSVAQSNIVENLKAEGVQLSYAAAFERRVEIQYHQGVPTPNDPKIVDSFRDLE